MKTETIKSEAEKVITLADLPEGSFIYKIAKANIQYHGYYTCQWNGVKTFIS